MSESDDLLARHATQAIETAARELGIAPLELARQLDGAGIARLLLLLNAAFRHVETPGLRHRIEALLLSVTGGRMPGESPETELDWALKVSRRRREEGRGEVGGESTERPEPGSE
jgi:hypothetical protein